MSSSQQQEDNIYRNYLRSIMMEELEKHDWTEQLRLKCRAYIKNNGTKTTTVDEVVDFLKADAFKTFPKNVGEICQDALKEMIESLSPV